MGRIFRTLHDRHRPDSQSFAEGSDLEMAIAFPRDLFAFPRDLFAFPRDLIANPPNR